MDGGGEGGSVDDGGITRVSGGTLGGVAVLTSNIGIAHGTGGTCLSIGGTKRT